MEVPGRSRKKVPGVRAYYYLEHLFPSLLHKMPNSQNWHFTVQTTPENEDEFLLHLSLVSEDPRVAYIVAGREVAPTTGQTHLQCFVRCHARQSFACLQALLPPCHLERARGSAEQGVRYCRKDGDYVEFGDVPNCDQRGRRTDWERFCDWARHLDAQPTDREIIEQFPSLFGRYAVSCRRIATLPQPPSKENFAPLQKRRKRTETRNEIKGDSRRNKHSCVII